MLDCLFLRLKNEKWDVVRACAGGGSAAGEDGPGAGTEFCLDVVLNMAGSGGNCEDSGDVAGAVVDDATCGT